jgi:hypothetical protein
MGTNSSVAVLTLKRTTFFNLVKSEAVRNIDLKPEWFFKSDRQSVYSTVHNAVT